MFCTKCGLQLNDQKSFCPRCGHPTHSLSAPVPTSSKPTFNNKIWQWLIPTLICTTVLLFTLMITFFVYVVGIPNDAYDDSYSSYTYSANTLEELIGKSSTEFEEINKIYNQNSSELIPLIVNYDVDNIVEQIGISFLDESSNDCLRFYSKEAGMLVEGNDRACTHFSLNKALNPEYESYSLYGIHIGDSKETILASINLPYSHVISANSSKLIYRFLLKNTVWELAITLDATEQASSMELTYISDYLYSNKPPLNSPDPSTFKQLPTAITTLHKQMLETAIAMEPSHYYTQTPLVLLEKDGYILCANYSGMSIDGIYLVYSTPNGVQIIQAEQPTVENNEDFIIHMPDLSSQEIHEILYYSNATLYFNYH